MENQAPSDSFILAVHGNEDILEILALAIDQRFSGKIVTAKSGKEAIAILERRSSPVCIISDDSSPAPAEANLLSYLKQKNIACPYIVCASHESAHPLDSYPGAFGVLQKVDLVPPLKKMLEEILKASPYSKRESDFSPIRLSVLLRLGFVNFDLYIKLSDSKFVKVSTGETEFAIEDAQKLMKKKVIDLYLKRADAEKLLQEFQQNILLLSKDSSLHADDMIGISNDVYQMTHSLAQSLGWSDEVQALAKQGTEFAVNAISKSPKLLNLLTKMNSSEDSYLATHSHFLTYICCGVAKLLEWTSDYTYTKLAMAALIHDITLTRSEELAIKRLNEAAYDAANTSAEIELYRQHPAKSVLLLNELKNLPPDIDKVILQHHERPDGTGFPGKISQYRINPLSTLFIVAEDLVDHLMGREDMKVALEEFIQSRKDRYGSGHFLKIFNALEASLTEGTGE